MPINIILYGGGGLAVETARYIQEINESESGSKLVVTDLIDDKKGRVDDLSTILGYTIDVHSTLATIEGINEKRIVLALGHSPIRDEKFQQLKKSNYRFKTLIHPSAQVSNTAKLGEGCIIAPFVLIGAFASIGDNVVVNIRSTIGHDANLGASCILSPHVVIGGSASCGRSVFFGAGAIINPGVKLGQFSKLSSGCIATSDVGPGNLVHGNPAIGRRIFNSDTGHSIFARAPAIQTPYHTKVSNKS